MEVADGVAGPGEAVPLGRPEPRRAPRTAALVAAGLVVLVLVPLGLLVDVGWAPVVDLDRAVGDALVVRGRGTDVDVLRVLTAGGLVEVRALALGPLAVWLAVQRRWQLVAFVVVGGFGIWPLNAALKDVFGRPRPSYAGTLDHGGLSFPSGHSAGAAAFATVLVVLAWPVLAGVWRRAWVGLAVGGTLVVGLTRIGLAAHYLSDVVAGWTVGIAWVLTIAVLVRVWPGQAGALSPRPPAVAA